MPNIAYVNGRYVNKAEAIVPMEDRGHQFADGIYEVMAFYRRTFLNEALHMKRLMRSLNELRIAPPVSIDALKLILRELLSRNDRDHGGIYLQITRGSAKRDHPFPKSAKPALSITVFGQKTPPKTLFEEGCKVITQPDQRWARRDIKTIALLPSVLAKQAAVEAGARDAWLIDPHRKVITETAAANAYIITRNGELITHPADENILWGCTRDVVLRLARKAKIPVVERPFTLEEALSAREAFLTSTTQNVLPVTFIDGKPIGNGAPGIITGKLIALYEDHIEKETGHRLWAA